MNKIILLILSAVSFSICTSLSSCGSGKANTLTSNIQFDSVKTDTVVALGTGKDAPRCALKLNILYAKGNLADKINHGLLKTGFIDNDYCQVDSNKNISVKDAVKKLVAKTIEGYKKDFGGLYKEDPTSMSLNYELDITTKINMSRDNIICYRADIYLYSGGAHGQSVTMIRNINQKDGEMLTKDKVFGPGSKDGVGTLIAKKLAKQYGLSNLKQLQDSLTIFSFDAPFIPDNFILEKDSIRFVYCSDEIACHAAGPQVAAVAYKDLRKFLK